MTVPWEDPRVVEGLDRQLAARDSALAAGAEHLGWKVGFGAPASLELMQITAPLLGYLTKETLISDGDHFVPTTEGRTIVEFEVAAWMGSDLGPGASDEEARAAVASLSPCIEIATVDLPIEAGAVPDIMAGDIFHEAVLFGERDESRAGIDIDGMSARIDVDGSEFGRTAELEAITGPYPWIVSTVASTLASRGLGLKAGDVIITGSVIPPIPITEGSHFTFHLDPFPPIAVTVGDS